MVVKSYEDLVVWRKGIDLAKETYRLTTKFPTTEKFGLSSQLQRAAVSVPSNIAEGQSRRNPGEFRQFLYHALGSLAELDTQLVLASELGYLTTAEAESARSLAGEIRRMTHSLVRRLPQGPRSNRTRIAGHRPPATGH